MGEPRWLDGYTGQTTDELIGLDGIYRTDSIVLAFEEAIGRKVERLGAERLTVAERVVLSVEALEREVNSDGYIGLFLNAPEHVSELVVSLMEIDRAEVADLTRAATATLGIDGPVTPEAIRSAAEEDDDKRDQRLNELDQAYYDTAGDLAGPLLAYIRANRADIILP